MDSSSTGLFFPPPTTKSKTKETTSLFDQVVARYREELEKLADDPNLKPLYIGIRQAGDEIHAWVLAEDIDTYTIDKIDQIHFELNTSLLLCEDYILLSFFFYPKYHGNYIPSDSTYLKLYPF
jgi:hypothetical protein